MNKGNGVFWVKIKDDRYNLKILFILLLCINLLAPFIIKKYSKVKYQKIDCPKIYCPKTDCPKIDCTKNNSQKLASIKMEENLPDKKTYILEQFSKFMKRNITLVDTLVLTRDWNFFK